MNCTGKPSFTGALLIAIWPLGILTSPLLGYQHGALDTLYVYQLAGLILPFPVLIIRAFNQGFGYRQLLRPISNRYIVALVLSWLPGSILGVSAGHSLIFIILTTLSFVIASYYVRTFTREDMRLGLALFATSGAMFLDLLALPYGFFSRGIKHGFEAVNINTIAFCAMTCASFAFAWRNTLLRYATLLLGVLLPITTNSRSSLLGLLVTVMVYTFAVDKGRESLQRFVLLVFIGGLIALFFTAPMIEVIKDITAFEDTHRGLGSGFSGRTDRWAILLNEFRDYPVLGIGFRCSELATGFPGESGYLTYLLETGIVGSLMLLMLIWTIFRKSIAHLAEPVNKILFSASCGYLAHSIFERFIFNTGNAGSLLFVMWIVYVMRYGHMQRKL